VTNLILVYRLAVVFILMPFIISSCQRLSNKWVEHNYMQLISALQICWLKDRISFS